MDQYARCMEGTRGHGFGGAKMDLAVPNFVQLWSTGISQGYLVVVVDIVQYLCTGSSPSLVVLLWRQDYGSAGGLW